MAIPPNFHIINPYCGDIDTAFIVILLNSTFWKEYSNCVSASGGAVFFFSYITAGFSFFNTLSVRPLIIA